MKFPEFLSLILRVIASISFVYILSLNPNEIVEKSLLIIKYVIGIAIIFWGIYPIIRLLLWILIATLDEIQINLENILNKENKNERKHNKQNA